MREPRALAYVASVFRLDAQAALRFMVVAVVLLDEGRGFGGA